eukprot:COSAG04_NODE_207_length_20357_cov_14.209843_2_plen_288_part_00
MEERDEKPVVDWISPKRMDLAQVDRLYGRPVYVIQKEEPPIAFWLEPDDSPAELGLRVEAAGQVAGVRPESLAHRKGVTSNYTLVGVGHHKVTGDDSEADIRDMLLERPVELKFRGGKTKKRLVFDKVDATLDGQGWKTGVAKDGQKPQPYPFDLDVDEMGTIGGVGLRLYFFLISFLCKAFVVMAVLTTPSIILQYTDSVYTHPEAVRYKTPLAMTTLGNVNATPAELESETVFSHRLWWISSIVSRSISLASGLHSSQDASDIVADRRRWARSACCAWCCAPRRR